MTRPKTTRPAASPGDKRMFYVSLGIFLATLVLVIASVISRNTSGSSTAGVNSPPTVEPLMTLAPELIANLTAIPQGIALTGDLPQQITELETQVKTCPDYSPQRRSQMEQHFVWLRDSSTMPREVALGIAANPAGRLILGMATFTAAEWGQRSRPANSCLLPIGRYLNTLLAQTGEEIFEEFEGG